MLVRVVRVRLAHDKVQLRTRVARSGDVPFVPVDADEFSAGGKGEGSADVGCVG
jgi:hypothetical protein